MSAHAADAGRSRPRRRLYTQLWFWVIVAIVGGIVFGLVAPEAAKKADWLADAFLQLIKTVTGPVIFVTVVIGISSLGNLARAGGLALRALGYFLVMTVIALTLGLLAGNIIAAGLGLRLGADRRERRPRPRRRSARRAATPASSRSSPTTCCRTSFLQPFVENKILRPRAGDPHRVPRSRCSADGLRRRVVGGFELASRVIFGMIRIIMWAAPIGAFGGMAFTVAQFGGGSLASLGLLAITFWGTCAVFVFGVLGLVGRICGFSIFRVIRLIRDELLIIVGTSSSETVLPRLLAKLQAAGASARRSAW